MPWLSVRVTKFGQVTVNGRHVSGAVEVGIFRLHRCLFDHLEVEATYNPLVDGIQCYSPSGLMGQTELSITLNAQQYNKVAAGFIFYGEVASS